MREFVCRSPFLRSAPMVARSVLLLLLMISFGGGCRGERTTFVGLAKEAHPPMVAVVSPSPGAVVRSPSLPLIASIDDPGATLHLRVQGKDPEGDGRFWTFEPRVAGRTIIQRIPLFRGGNEIELVAENEVGERRITFEVERIEARSERVLTVELAWEEEEGGRDADLDLHLLRGDGPLGSAEDCHYANCLAQPGMTLDWGVPADRADDPRLDRDASVGTGDPRGETIFLSRLEAVGRYTVVVTPFHGRASATVTITTPYGRERFGPVSLDADDPERLRWNVATILAPEALVIEGGEVSGEDGSSRLIGPFGTPSRFR